MISLRTQNRVAKQELVKAPAMSLKEPDNKP